MTTEKQQLYYAQNVARHLAKVALQKFIAEWAKNREPIRKANKAVNTPFTLVYSTIVLSIDEEGEKRLNGHKVADFWQFIPEKDAKQLLCEKPYLKSGRCTWDQLWESLKIV